MNEIEHRVPDADHLRTFTVIAACGNLTQAAAHLHRTQSAISIQLRKLEETLLVTLFERHARGMTLTSQGEALLPVARRALGELDRAASLFADPLAGRVRVGIPDDLEDSVLEAALAAFSARHPNVEVQAQSGCTAAYPDALRRGDLDVAICSDTRQLTGELLGTEPIFWAAAVDFELRDEAPLPLALLDRGCWWRSLPTDALDRVGRAWRVAYRSSSFPSIRSAIRSGLAIGPLPARCVEPAMRVLTAADSLPALPESRRRLLVAPGAAPQIAAAMRDALRLAVLTRTG
jgi:DNA-binding transcriptional LysR family regulator